MRKAFLAMAAMAAAAAQLNDSSKDFKESSNKFSDLNKKILSQSTGPIFFPSKTMKINRKRMLKRMK